MKLKLLLAFLLGCLCSALVCFLFARWYLGGSTPVSIENRSGVVLEDVYISGSGYKAYVGEVWSKYPRNVRVYPYGETSLRIEFRANGRQLSIPLDEYIEGGGGYRVQVVVDANLKPSIAVDAYSKTSLLLP